MILSIAHGHGDKYHHHKYLCMIVFVIVLFDLQLYFINYNSFSMNYEWVLYAKNVLFMQQKWMFIEGLCRSHT